MQKYGGDRGLTSRHDVQLSSSGDQGDSRSASGFCLVGSTSAVLSAFLPVFTFFGLGSPPEAAVLTAFARFFCEGAGAGSAGTGTSVGG